MHTIVKTMEIMTKYAYIFQKNVEPMKGAI